MRKTIDFPKRLLKLDDSLKENLIKNAFFEDLGARGDITTLATVSKFNITKTADIIAKESGIVCGIELFEKSFLYLDREIFIEKFKIDGEKVERGEIIAKVSGKADKILSAERVALNFLGFLSGIATKVFWLVSRISGSNTKLLDTRKTLPGLRILEKYAVATGGGYNHRIGLFDMFLIKENHIFAVGSIKEAVRRAKEFDSKMIVEVEIQSLDQIDEVMGTEAEIVMLDNMNDDEVKKGFFMLKEEKYVEVSGNVNEERLLKLAEIGVDFVSMGSLTHTLKPLDISLLIKS
jgi:nicotinate-nucleotide pyrophosphorylase (carboxylating)